MESHNLCRVSLVSVLTLSFLSFTLALSRSLSLLPSLPAQVSTSPPPSACPPPLPDIEQGLQRHPGAGLVSHTQPESGPLRAAHLSRRLGEGIYCPLIHPPWHTPQASTFLPPSASPPPLTTSPRLWIIVMPLRTRFKPKPSAPNPKASTLNPKS